MKIRQGFVSNSSSSSFVCSCCNGSYAGYDGQYEDTLRYSCVNDHDLCSDCVREDVEDSETYDIKEKHCPICSFEVSDEHDIFRFLEKTSGISRNEVYNYRLAFFPKLTNDNKTVRVEDYLSYVCARKGITLIEIRAYLKNRFKKYSKFLKFLDRESKNTSEKEDTNILLEIAKQHYREDFGK